MAPRRLWPSEATAATCKPRRKLFDASRVFVTRSIGVAKPQQTNMLVMPPDAFGSAYKSRKRGMQRVTHRRHQPVSNMIEWGSVRRALAAVPPSVAHTCVEKLRV